MTELEKSISPRIPKVAVLLPTYNGEKYLGEQIESILSLEGVVPTIFVNDDGSTDNTLNVISDYQCDNLVKLDSKKCGGAAQNFFHLLISTPIDQFDYVCFSDQDDLWHTFKLKRAIEELRINNVSVYSSDVVGFWPNGKTKYITKSQPMKRADYIFESAGPGNTFVFSVGAAIIIRNFLSSIPETSLNRIALHDWFIYSYCRSKKIPWKIDRFGGVFYRQHEGNVLGASSGINAMRKRISYMASGWYLKQISLQVGLIGDIESDHFVKKIIKFITSPSLKGLLFVLSNIGECRRKKSDRIALYIFLIVAYLRLVKI